MENQESILALEIRVNDDDPIVAGAADLSVLSAMLTHVKDRGGCDLSIAGLIVHSESEHEHVRWEARSLQVGDQVAVRIIENTPADPPRSRDRIDPSAPPTPTEG